VPNDESNASTPGDLNGDGEVNASDLTILARHVGKVETMEDETALANADVTGDGNVDASDLTKLAQYVGKIISSLD
ncbi:MAG: dockerin type I repeat-containing protein, partial [Oscillospiraceae bacterium]|nr:dockerin type I repeat-containing protein [Oscillospiraceae bacterium]